MQAAHRVRRDHVRPVRLGHRRVRQRRLRAKRPRPVRIRLPGSLPGRRRADYPRRGDRLARDRDHHQNHRFTAVRRGHRRLLHRRQHDGLLRRRRLYGQRNVQPDRPGKLPAGHDELREPRTPDSGRLLDRRERRLQRLLDCVPGQRSACHELADHDPPTAGERCNRDQLQPADGFDDTGHEGSRVRARHDLADLRSGWYGDRRVPHDSRCGPVGRAVLDGLPDGRFRVRRLEQQRTPRRKHHDEHPAGGQRG